MPVYWKWVIKSVPNLGLGLLMLASTVTPRHASSNMAAWFIYFGVENVPSWLANKSADTWAFWIGLVGFCGWAMCLYVPKNLRNGKLSIMIREGEPWVQVNPGVDQSQTAHTYRIALVNSDDSTLRNVEVKLTSLEKKPQNFHAIGSHLILRDDRVGTINFNVHPTKDPELMLPRLTQPRRFSRISGFFWTASVANCQRNSRMFFGYPSRAIPKQCKFTLLSQPGKHSRIYGRHVC